MTEHETFMRRAIELAREGMVSAGGGPFGSVIVRNGKIIGEGSNRVTATNDPTAHAEVVAIRDACRNIGSFQLDGCVIYASCEPCPMCLGAIYWSRAERVYIAGTRNERLSGFDDAFIYDEISKEMDDRKVSCDVLLRDEGLKVFNDGSNAGQDRY